MGLSHIKGNSGYIGVDKRGEVSSTGTTGSVSVRKHYLERKRGNFAPISPTPSNVLFEDEVIGFIGEVHPKVLENFGFLVPISVLEINLNNIF